MNLFRSEAHARRWWGYDPAAADGTLPVQDSFGVEFCRAKLDPHFFRGLELRQGLFRALAELGNAGPFWSVAGP
jgi:hypothetical protein